jgi:DNA-binding transcriptional ArsR family regulator
MAVKDKGRAQRARTMALRAVWCRRVAIQRRRRHLCALVDLLAEYGSISDALPYPTEVRMARDLGVHERTVRRWVAELRDLGLIEVRSSRPQRDPQSGRWFRRASNRYVLCDRRARGSGVACPVPRRRLSVLVLPTGHQCPVTGPPEVKPPGGGRSKAADPPQPEMTKVADLRPPSATHHHTEPPAPQTRDQGERERVAELLAAMRATVGPTRRRR